MGCKPHSVARAHHLTGGHGIFAVGLYVVCAGGSATRIPALEAAELPGIPVFRLLDCDGISRVVSGISDCAGARSQVSPGFSSTRPITGVMAIPGHADGSRPARIGSLRLLSQRPYGAYDFGVLEHAAVWEASAILALFCL